jgi:hypothetical protein
MNDLGFDKGLGIQILMVHDGNHGIHIYEYMTWQLQPTQYQSIRFQHTSK